MLSAGYNVVAINSLKAKRIELSIKLLTKASQLFDSAEYAYKS
jgi:hypothetical protein